mmetsp:Transcript_17276/g.25695  ORF Transcript_17276/g.25695 Transcript_17276/m.25695 type:complete len:258 (-) Transcript_17276:123-896(-)|eukprot:CAMPEP_0201548932 /NCGR_PEP_ID=MMETSP0173_2-20130828/5433_1 /ASSEMBLY_ACC=CAM_ASM_000268 /TAXON_ID=218659 /ORGANISM="Vexillifera sp., Strain DIVA3 564/2" /LENGTH=257 /DNA_ID=CAMNT_0047958453 /DNA_START=105 /DNA_END=878 /DNA_ORIENTATION=+
MGQLLNSRTVESRHCTPINDLYPTCPWDAKVLKKTIVDKQLAPIFKGEQDAGKGLEECPICFLWYPGGLNRVKCCKQSICTECFTQIKKPAASVMCPFCTQEGFDVSFRGPKTDEELREEQQDVDNYKAAQQRQRQEEIERDQKRQQEREAAAKKKSNTLTTNASSVVVTTIDDDDSPTSSSSSSSSTDDLQQVASASKSAQIPDNDSSSTSSTSSLTNHVQTLNLGTPQQQDPQAAAALEEQMLAEAIRLSLLQSE